MLNINVNPPSATAAYLQGVRRKIALCGVLLLVTLLVVLYAVSQGACTLSPVEVIRVFLGLSGTTGDVVIWNIRMPRIIAALVVGWGLSISGLGIQSLLKNPLGAPSTLGISQGAAFGAALAIVIFGARMFSVTAFAFTGAMGATGVILGLGRLRRLTPEAIILAGVALASLFASATVLIQYVATETQLAVVVFWTFGDVARSNWMEIGLLAAVTLFASAYFMIRRWDLNALASGKTLYPGPFKDVDLEKRRMTSTGFCSAGACMPGW
ncbi:MAG: iron ABC transporter permease [Pseudomonadota bacterium]